MHEVHALRASWALPRGPSAPAQAKAGLDLQSRKDCRIFRQFGGNSSFNSRYNLEEMKSILLLKITFIVDNLLIFLKMLQSCENIKLVKNDEETRGKPLPCSIFFNILIFCSNC